MLGETKCELYEILAVYDWSISVGTMVGAVEEQTVNSISGLNMETFHSQYR